MNPVRFIRNIFFPPECVLCSFMMEPDSESNVCGKCYDRLHFCSDSLCCVKCGKPQVSFGKKQLCYFCVEKKSRHFDRIVSVFEYKGVITEAVMRYKEYGVRRSAEFYARVMAARFYEEYSDAKIDFVCAAPSHKDKRAVKGFEHIEEICRHFSKETGIKHYKRVLVKTRKTKKQGRLTLEERMKNLTDSMKVCEGMDVRGKRILLLDDVCTTRSTVSECAKTLKRQGAKRVYALTLATTVNNR